MGSSVIQTYLNILIYFTHSKLTFMTIYRLIAPHKTVRFTIYAETQPWCRPTCYMPSDSA
jgi:hypothetical protein